MGQTISEKILARASGQETVKPGDIVTCQVDLAMVHDSSGPRTSGKKLDELGVPVWDMSKLVVISDHYVNLDDAAAKNVQDICDTWCETHKVQNFIRNQGICHIVLPQEGHVKPGMFCVGADSHSTTAGAFGAFMVGVGATEITGVMATGEIWARVPENVRMEVTGNLKPGVAGKDVILKICGDHGIMGFGYQVVEFCGEGVTNMSAQDRMTLTNMAAEIGAKTGIIAPDAKTVELLASWGVTGIDPAEWQSDADAVYAKHIKIDGNALAPQVAAPSSPENADDVGNYKNVKLNQAYLGACTGAKLEDLRMAAQVMKGKKVASGTRFLVAPSTVKMRELAAAEGTLGILEEAGATILPSGCGGCIGLGDARLAEDAVGISSTNRNFVGRAGPASSKLYLASPFTVAASAVAGEIADPRDMI